MLTQVEVARVLDEYRESVRKKSPRSLQIYEQNKTVMPGGVGSRFRLSDPFPMVVKEARGARLWDADGNEYLDCMLSFGVMILGNAAPEVLAAVQEALPRGTSYALCHEREYEFAKLIVDMVPGVEKVSLCNSGTEATMYAIRLARASTGRRLVAKFEGGYHGTHDFLLVNVQRPRLNPQTCGPAEDPWTVPEYPGLLEGAFKDTIVLPFNNPAAFEKIRRHANDLAAVIIEPVQGGGGTIPAEPEFLRELRAVTERCGTWLIFDEVITGFRLAPGGAQEYYGVIPDVATFGKALSGGFPLGALGGKADKMSLLEYDKNPSTAILIGGTFNGNPITVAAGTATLKRLKSDPGLYTRLNAMGDRFRAEINAFAKDHGFQAVATGVGSMIWMHTVPGPVKCNRDLSAENVSASTGLKLLFRLKGLHISANHGFLSAAHTDEDITRLINIHKEAMLELRERGIW